jgi:hypothetical protein
MSEMQEIADNLHADAQVILFLHKRDYRGLLKFIDAQYGLKFIMEQTGASFEDCIDCCAQNAGGIDNARQVLLLLFERYYLDLPKPVRADLLYLAEEVGYDPKRTKLDELKALCRPVINRGAANAVSLTQVVRVFLRSIQVKRKERAARSRPVGVPRFLARRRGLDRREWAHRSGSAAA